MTQFKTIGVSLDEAGMSPRITRVGVLVLASDGSIEPDIHSMLPARFAAHFSRMDNYETTAERRTNHRFDLALSTKLLAECDDLSAVIYGCTSGELTYGHDLIIKVIEDIIPNAQVVTPMQAAVEAAYANEIGSISILSPYGEILNQRMVQLFGAAGITVKTVFSPKAWSGRSLSSIDAHEFEIAVKAMDVASSKGLFIPCNALAIVNAIEGIEANIGLPVLTSTQVSVWKTLCSLGGIEAMPPTKFGAIFLQKTMSSE